MKVYVSALVLLMLPAAVFAQTPIVERGPGPAYKAIGVHRLVKRVEAGCVMERYSGTVQAVQRDTNPYLVSLTGKKKIVGFSIKGRGGNVAAFPIGEMPGLSESDLLAVINKGRIVDVRAFRCGSALLPDSIEAPLRQ